MVKTPRRAPVRRKDLVPPVQFKNAKKTLSPAAVDQIQTAVTPGWTQAHADMFSPKTVSVAFNTPSPFRNRRMTRRTSVYVKNVKPQEVLSDDSFKKPTTRPRKQTMLSHNVVGPRSPAMTRSRRRTSVYITTNIHGFSHPKNEKQGSRNTSPIKKPAARKSKTPKKTSRDSSESQQKSPQKRSTPKSTSLAVQSKLGVTSSKTPVVTQTQKDNQTTPKNQTNNVSFSPRKTRQTPAASHKTVTKDPRDVMTPSQASKITPQLSQKRKSIEVTPQEKSETPKRSKTNADIQKSALKTARVIVVRTPLPSPRTPATKLNKSAHLLSNKTSTRNTPQNKPPRIAVVTTPRTPATTLNKSAHLLSNKPSQNKPTPSVQNINLRISSSKATPQRSNTPIEKQMTQSHSTSLKKTSTEKSLRINVKPVNLPYVASPLLNDISHITKGGKNQFVKTPFKAAKMLGKSPSPTGDTPIKAARLLGKLRATSANNKTTSRTQENTPLTSTPRKSAKKRVADPPPVSEIRQTKTSRKQPHDEESVFLAPKSTALEMAGIKTTLNLDNSCQAEVVEEVGAVNGDLSVNGNTSLHDPRKRSLDTSFDARDTWWGYCTIL